MTLERVTALLKAKVALEEDLKKLTREEYSEKNRLQKEIDVLQSLIDINDAFFKANGGTIQ